MKREPPIDVRQLVGVADHANAGDRVALDRDDEDRFELPPYAENDGGLGVHFLDRQ